MNANISFDQILNVPNPNNENVEFKHVSNQIENDCDSLLEIMFDESDNSEISENKVNENTEAIKYFKLLKDIKQLSNNHVFECICTKVFRNKKLFSDHKNNCQKIKNVLLNYYEQCAKTLLPDGYIYNISHKGAEFTGNFEQWFNNLNTLDHKYNIFSNSTKKGSNVLKYIYMRCHAHEIFNCQFQINAIVDNEKNNVTVSFQHNHSHAANAIITDKSGFETTLLLNNKRLDNSTKERLLDFFYDGLSPTVACNRLKSESNNYLKESQHRSQIPYLRTFYYLFEKERNINFGPQSFARIV